MPMLIKPIKALLLHNPHTQCAENYTPATLLGTPCQYHVGTLFALRTAFILSGIDSEILVHSDMIACSCCGFGNFPSPHSNGSLFHRDLVTGEAI